MNIHRIFPAGIIIFAVLAAVCIILLFLNSSLAVQSLLTAIAVGIGIVVWIWRNRKKQPAYLSNTNEWAHIQAGLKDWEQTNRYILKLDEQQSQPTISKQDDTLCIRISNPEHLSAIATGLLNQHPEQTVALGIELSVYPTLDTDMPMHLKDCLRNILFLQKHLNMAIPVSLLVHAPQNLLVAQDSVTPSAFSLKLQHGCEESEIRAKSPISGIFSLKLQHGCEESDICKLMDNFQQALAESFLHTPKTYAGVSANYFRVLQVIACIKEVFQTQAHSGWAYLNMRSISVVPDAETFSHSLWQQFIRKTTGGLSWPEHDSFANRSAHFQDHYAAHAFYRKNLLADWLLKLLSIATIAFIAAASCSAWNNRQLLTRLQTDLQTYKKSSNDASLQAQAKEKLQQDLALLQQHRQQGIPMHLSLGLYRAEMFIAPLEKILSSPATPAQQTKPAVVLTLDSLALFETGQYELKHNANKALIGVLNTIDQHPNTQIMVEGHTDNVGNQAANQQLSEKRAMAVRDWLVISSNIPASRFAVKGYGDTRPVADNATEAGRAKNRRVEIILIPDKILSGQ